MKRIIISFVILLGSIGYLIGRITTNTLSLSNISMTAENPISFNGLKIGIDTKLIENSSESIYYISMIPVYALILVAILCLIFGLRKLKK